MLRKMVIALAAAAALTAGSMIPASAHGGGHGGGGGGMGHGGGMGVGHGGFGQGGFAHGGFAPHSGFHGHDGRFAFGHHHRFFFNRFAFYGSGYPYDDGCYRHVWTRWGWRWVSVCY
jgi:hypothetical protein